MYKVDINQHEIVVALRQVYALVFPLAMVGKGMFDLLVLYRGDLYLLEVKHDKNGLTPAQEKFYAEWGKCKRVGVVRSPDEALKFIGAIK